MPFTDPTVALVHDYFVQDGGAEAVAVELSRMFPDAPIHTTFFERGRFGDRIDPRRIRSWRLQGLVGPSPWFRPLLPAYIAYFSTLQVRASRLVISTSSTFARGAAAGGETIHVAYIHTPMRFAWDVNGYLAGSSFPLPARTGLRAIAPALRRWDRWAGRRPDVLVANSRNVQRRIALRWGRESQVIHPPVDVSGVQPSARDDGFYLVACRLLAYKRVDLAIEACARLGAELVVVGDGPERARLQAMAGSRTTFAGHVARSRLQELLGRCHALIVPGIEDFGMTPVEAMATGKPVIAFGAGGVLETIVDGQTGVLFDRQDARTLTDAITRLDSMSLDPAIARVRALEFDVPVFHLRWGELLAELGLSGVLGPIAPAAHRGLDNALQAAMA
ncbi:MAG: glycosyltransferase [Chloroflexota bacterium]|nr:glycosyltransferase [Chloroflexota bacterium]